MSGSLSLGEKTKKEKGSCLVAVVAITTGGWERRFPARHRRCSLDLRGGGNRRSSLAGRGGQTGPRCGVGWWWEVMAGLVASGGRRQVGGRGMDGREGGCDEARVLAVSSMCTEGRGGRQALRRQPRPLRRREAAPRHAAFLLLLLFLVRVFVRVVDQAALALEGAPRGGLDLDDRGGA